MQVNDAVREMVLLFYVYIVYISPFQLFRDSSYWFSIDLGTRCPVSFNVLVVAPDAEKNAEKLLPFDFGFFLLSQSGFEVACAVYGNVLFCCIFSISFLHRDNQ